MSDPCLDTLRVLGHELRRPLTVIRGASTLLIDDSDALPAASRTQMLGMIDRSATAMSDLIDDLLAAVHLELGDITYAPEALDLPALVADAVEAARYEDPEREVLVSGVDGLRAEADHEHALRVLRSLLVNGIRYSPGTGPVELAAGAAGDRVELSVLDRGPGIPAREREKAFEKFSRLDPNTGGAGLGLFLARGL
ncbi:MAG TPA: HAMP domain-containing sensor histidine kinase, partial [Candidatus Dormibacteraeota bacterium]|nr:HAMP domain-containing sensor histidine kinase [Candidatus Dormibacteraeota bacterium]